MVALANPAKRFIETMAQAWDPVDYGPTSRWISRNVRLSVETEGSPGAYDIEGLPWWQEICDAFHDQSVETISLQKSTQVGGTLCELAMILATSVIDPAPGMIVVPTQDEARLIRDRIYANALVSDRCLASKVPPERLQNLLSIDLKTCQTYLAWSGSKQRLRGKPCKWVWLSEIDVYESAGDAGSQCRAAERRTDQFPGSTVMRESTPVGDESQIANYYDASDARQWWCACPKCGRRQVVRFFPYKFGEHAGKGGVVGYTDEKGQLIDPELAHAEAFYKCLTGCHIESSAKNKFMRSGVWLADGQSFDEQGRIQGEPLRSGRHRGYHIWQAHNLKKSWGDLAATYIQHQREGQTRDFFQNVLGLRFRSAARLPEWHKLGKRMAGKHQQGFVPAEVWFLTCGVDVQSDRVYFVVRGWAPGRNSYLIDWGEFLRDESELLDDETQGEKSGVLVGSDLEQIDQLLQREYVVLGENPLGRRTLQVRLFGIDSKHRIAEVHEYVSTRKTTRLRAIQGDHQIGPKEKFRMNVVEKNVRTGKVYEGGLQLWGIKVDVYKQLMVDRIRGSNDAIGNYWLPEDMPRIGAKYLRQLVNEPPTQELDKRTGRKKTVFKPRTKEIGVDFWDTTNYSEALADMVVAKIGWSHTAWENWKSREHQTAKRRKDQAKREPADILHV